MKLAEDKVGKKTTHNGCLVQFDSSVIWDSF